MKTGLFFGSFNPVHNGHLILANYILEYSDLQQLWFVVSPQNPLKEKKSLLADYHRLELIRLAVGDSNKYRVSDIEFRMPKPSYTIDTLSYLSEKNPEKEFVLIMGADSFKSIHKWKNSQLLLKNYHIIVYPRPNVDISEFPDNSNISVVKAPLMEISSTFIRNSIKNNKDVRFYMPERAYSYMREMHFYEK